MQNWRHILAAVDDSRTSIQALHYIGEVCGCTADLEVTLLHIYPEPPPDYYRQGHTLQAYQQSRQLEAGVIFAKCRDVLAEYGIPGDRCPCLCRMAEEGETISRTLLRVRAELGHGTVVVGKRGVSKAEEFLFGSISNSVARAANGFTVWIVG